MAFPTRTRIITIRKGEEAIIRAQPGSKHITIEFGSSILTVFEERGALYTRMETQDKDNMHDSSDDSGLESDSEADIETQPMTPLLRRKSLEINAFVRSKRMSRIHHAEKPCTEQANLFTPVAGDTQIID